MSSNTPPAQPAKPTERGSRPWPRALTIFAIGVPLIVYSLGRAWIDDEITLGLFSGLVALTACFAAYLGWKRRDKRLALRIAIASLSAFFLYLILHSGDEHARGLWFLCLPLVTIMLLPPREGIVWSLCAIAAAIVLMNIAGPSVGGVPYTDIYIVRFAVVALLISGVLFWSEVELEYYRLGLHAKNRALAEERDHLEHEIEQRVVLEDELRYLATTDPLTGLYNRRAFMSMLSEEIGRSLRLRDRFTLLMLDIDHFKQINDRYGHPTGDAVLNHFAGLLAGHLRRVDKLARIGGEEFAILLVGTTAEEARGVVARLLDSIRSQPAAHPESREPIPLTASIGCTESRADDDELAALSRADRALYAAKRGGRNDAHWI